MCRKRMAEGVTTHMFDDIRLVNCLLDCSLKYRLAGMTKSFLAGLCFFQRFSCGYTPLPAPLHCYFQRLHL